MQENEVLEELDDEGLQDLDPGEWWGHAPIRWSHGGQ